MSKPYQNKPKSAMFDKLMPLKKQFKKPQQESNDNIRDPYPSPMQWAEDGEDHINITDSCATELGRVLAHNAELPLSHKIFGKFITREAFWHYIQSNERDDRLRTMHGPTLKTFAIKLSPARVINFKAIIIDTNWQWLKQYKVVAEQFAKSELPLECYYENRSGIRVRPNYFPWYLSGMEELRKALKENREPDLSFLLDRPGTGIYEFVIPAEKQKKAKPTPKSSLLKEAAKAAKKDEVTQTAVEETVDRSPEFNQELQQTETTE